MPTIAMQGRNSAARVNFCIRRSSALMRDLTNCRQIHQSPSLHKMAALGNADTDVSKVNRQYRQQVATDGLRTFIEKVTAKPKEARMWLKYFKSKAYWDESQAFCVLHVTEDVFYSAKMLETFAWSAAFLMQNKMKPVVVFGSRRRTTETLQDMENKLEILGARLQKLLNQHGVASDLFTADHQLIGVGEDGKLEINVDGIKECLLDDHIPMVTNLVTGSNKFRLYDPVSVAEIITRQTRPMKLMFLSCEKGIEDHSGRVISDIILPVANDTEAATWNLRDHKQRIKRIGRLLEELPAESSVILTSADTVIQELFTHHGSGTMIKRSEPVHRYNSLDDVNKEELTRLLSDSFQKPLPETYFQSIHDMVDSIYVSESYSAAAIILKDPSVPLPYMDKFAVRTSSQGLGLTTQVWAEVVKDYHQLFWRSKPTNHGALGWYNTVCQGSWKDTSWIVFWYGLQTCKQVFPLIDYAVGRKGTFDAALDDVPAEETNDVPTTEESNFEAIDVLECRS